MGNKKSKIRSFYKKRNIWKTVTWRIISLLLSFSVGFLITGSLESGGLFALFDFCIKSIIYYYHEVSWNKYTIKKIRKLKNKSVKA
tara:strand:+ start:22474 stop:22731 length:258 start_codon:yes stop_codon:yes gene_type:complete